MRSTVPQEQINRIVHAYHHDPFQVLGAHLVEAGGTTMVSIRAFLPLAERAWVVRPQQDGDEHEAKEAGELVRQPGTDFFEAQFPGQAEIFPYEICTEDKDGVVRQFRDPYSFLPVLGDLDLLLFNQGNHYRTYEKLGAQVMMHQGVAGTCFAVWAPNAAR